MALRRLLQTRRSRWRPCLSRRNLQGTSQGFRNIRRVHTLFGLCVVPFEALPPGLWYEASSIRGTSSNVPRLKQHVSPLELPRSWGSVPLPRIAEAAAHALAAVPQALRDVQILHGGYIEARAQKEVIDRYMATLSDCTDRDNPVVRWESHVLQRLQQTGNATAPQSNELVPLIHRALHVAVAPSTRSRAEQMSLQPLQASQHPEKESAVQGACRVVRKVSTYAATDEWKAFEAAVTEGDFRRWPHVKALWTPDVVVGDASANGVSPHSAYLTVVRSNCPATTLVLGWQEIGAVFNSDRLNVAHVANLLETHGNIFDYKRVIVVRNVPSQGDGDPGHYNVLLIDVKNHTLVLHDSVRDYRQPAEFMKTASDRLIALAALINDIRRHTVATFPWSVCTSQVISLDEDDGTSTGGVVQATRDVSARKYAAIRARLDAHDMCTSLRSEWNCVVAQCTPLQKGNVDCGPFALRVAKHLALDLRLPTETHAWASNVVAMRRIMALEIIAEAIIDQAPGEATQLHTTGAAKTSRSGDTRQSRPTAAPKKQPRITDFFTSSGRGV